MIIPNIYSLTNKHILKGCDSNFEAFFFLQKLKVATNETSTLHYTIGSTITLEIYQNDVS